MEKKVDLKLNICNFINDALAKSGKTNTELAKFLNVSETELIVRNMMVFALF